MDEIKKPELLLPAGNIEMALAAFEGGADAVYAGMHEFSARNRARNFTINELYTLTEYAKQHDKKVYLTFNTLLKNKETFDFIDLMSNINQMKPDAIIIQDWAVYYILKKYFSNLNFHASTQMGIHNSIGETDSENRGFQRVILARELTFSELKEVCERTNMELELFVHGSLCYSFSGHCLFSSFLGGMSANRGNCKQPCRRMFTTSREQNYLFSLKDLQLIDKIPEMMKFGIHSFKIEGRMKSIDYVYHTARAYRMVIDNPRKMNEAKEILNKDLGREKTSYFIGEDVHDVFTSTPSVGLLLGNVAVVDKEGIVFKSKEAFQNGAKIRVIGKDDQDADIIDVSEIYNEQAQHIEKVDKDTTIRISVKNKNIRIDDEIYLVSDKTNIKLPQLKMMKLAIKHDVSLRNRVLKDSSLTNPGNDHNEFYLRIDHPDWLKFINKDQITGLIVSFTKRYWIDKNDFLDQLKFYQSQVIIELPLFMAEDSIEFYKLLVEELMHLGYKNFSISQINQLQLFKMRDKVNIMSNEAVYALNDFAIKFLREEKMQRYIYPLENDIDNLLTGKDRSGIIPLYYFPKLFYSRMPINLKPDEEFKDAKHDYRKYIRDGMTVITSKQAVSLFQYHNKLLAKGFKRYLADVSFTIPEAGLINQLMKAFTESLNIENSSKFNFKKGLW